MATESPRGKVVAYIGLGANLGRPIQQLAAARHALGQHPGIREIAHSRLYRSAPMGPAGQPDYFNAVMAVETDLAPSALLSVLQATERQLGRTRNGERWGPRTLDLDLLLYGDERIRTDALHVPHPGIPEREFVLVPLLEIAPDLVIPDCGPVRDLLRTCPRRNSELIVADDPPE